MNIMKRRALTEETVQREIMCGMLDASKLENLLWATERILSDVFIPLLKNSNMAEIGTDHLQYKVEKNLLPSMRSFARCTLSKI